MRLTLWIILAIVSAVKLSPLGAADIATDMTVTVIDSVDVPSMVVGKIAIVHVVEGAAVGKGDALAVIDDREAKLNEQLARTRWEIARAKVEDVLATEIADVQLSVQQQQQKRQSVLREIADRKAGNDARVLASQKTEAVAKNELDRAIRSRQEFVDSISRSEIDGLRLAYEKTGLETRQAMVDHGIDALSAKAEFESAVEQELKIELIEKQRQQALANKQIQRLEWKLHSQQAELAAQFTEKHQVKSPLSGIVVERFRTAGDWVDLGDPVVRVIRLDRLRAEGYAGLDQLSQLRRNRTVELVIRTGGEDVVRRQGEIVFISPEIDLVNSEVRFWVEFDNPKGDVLPGMRADASWMP